MLVWIDLETTGLDPAVDGILEVACVVTDDDITPESERVFHAIAQTYASWDALHPAVQEMHGRSGLWAACQTAEETSSEILERLATFIADACPPPPEGVQQQRPLLAGNSVHFDRAFLRVDAPAVLALLHYRNLDVSSLNEAMLRWWPEAWRSRPGADLPREQLPHRALDDIRSSIEVARHYRRQLTRASSYQIPTPYPESVPIAWTRPDGNAL